MISINLLDNRRKAIIERKLKSTRANLAGISILVVAGIITIASFSLNSYQKRQLANAEKRVTVLENQITSYSEVFFQLEQLKEKVKAVGQILATRDLASEKIDLFFEIYNSQMMNIRSVGLGGVSQPLEFEISGDVANVRQFTETNQYFRELGDKLGLDYITLRNIGRGNTGNYNLDYLIRFSDEVQK